MKIAILGSTGSVGRNVIDVAKNLNDVEVYGITANKSTQVIEKQIKEVTPRVVVIADEKRYKEFKRSDIEVLSGSDGMRELVTCREVDVVVNALSGLAGLGPMLQALSAGKKVAVANKEAIVMGWGLIKKAIKYPEQIIPVDSEHSAIFQIMKGESRSEIKRIILTASGGAVYNRSGEELEKINFNDCLNHPTWKMSDKITIDSALLMNKGLEVIEAHNLFDIDYSKIDVYIHPQSVVHGMVEFVDGSIIAHLASADMRIPIQYALTHPNRLSSPGSPLRIEDMCRLEFSRPDSDRFPCLNIAIEAGISGGIKPILLCAADEVAVEAFIQGKIKFTMIPEIIRQTLEKSVNGTAEKLEDIEAIYSEAKKIAGRIIKK